MTARRIAVVSAGLSNPSSTRMLADKLAAATVADLAAREVVASVDAIELREYAHDITNNLLTGFAPMSTGIPCSASGSITSTNDLNRPE